MKKFYFVIMVLAQLSANAVTWKVGSSQTYTSCSQVVNLVGNGDTIKFDGGVYLNDPVTWIKKDLVFIGLGTGSNRSIMRWNAGDIANGKGLWVFGNPAVTGNATVDNIVFEGARVSDANGGNGAGIRCQAKNLTIRNCLFDSCQNGILEGGAYSAAIVTIQNSEFRKNGYEVIGNATYSGYEHNIYISAQTDSLLVKDCWFHDPRGEANSIKTRAQKSYILYNLIDEANGQGSWEIDIAQGGLNVIIGNTVIQGANSINHGIIGYDAVTNTVEDFYFINNTVINRYAGNFKYFNVVPASGVNKFKVYNNIFATVSGGTMTNFISGTLGSALDTLANRVHPNYTTVGFVNGVGNDFHLTLGAVSFINNCANAGNASNGFSLLPVSEYSIFVSPLVTRVMTGFSNDIGAYEYSPPAGINENQSLQNFSIIFPNPASTYFKIKINSVSDNCKIIICDVLGKEIQRSVISHNETVIDLNSEFKKGIYFYSIQSQDQKTINGKLVVE